MKDAFIPCISGPLFLGIFLTFGICALIQLFYYCFFYLRVPFFKKKYINEVKPPVSVVICARNEAVNLQMFLPDILEQKYPEFEVIVVDDRSDDNTQEVLRSFSKDYKNLRISTINRDPILTHAKKLAQTIGIKAAKNETLLFTDADCKVESDSWISSMVGNFTDKTELVIGYGGYFSKKGFVNKIIRYDTMLIAVQYISYALAGIPYMGVGRNLAYYKSAFFRNRGFASHAHLQSGDDDLLVNEIATKHNTRVEYSLESHTRSVPESSFVKWLNQKQRHLTTGSRYKWFHKLLLSTELITRVAFYITFVILAVLDCAIVYVGAAFLVRLVVQLVVIKICMIRLNEKDLLLYSLLIDVILPFIYAGLTMKNYIITRRMRWK